jgi:peptide/nickel transport system ATP-binding protein
MSLLQVENLRTAFGSTVVVDGLSFSVEAGETLAIVGESGSGKSVTAMSIMRLLQTPPARLEGKVMFKGRDLLSLSEAEMRQVRGAQISMVFQEPMSSLNPVLTVGDQIAEAVKLHQRVSHAEAWRRALDMLTLVGIPAPERRIREYPHKLSGGMRQRVVIAMALACDPALLIADEPTTALDVTVQAQILDLIRAQKARLGSAVILITHDLGVVAELADRVIVMYAGRVVEEAKVADLFANPRHPYTRGLLAAMPRLGSSLGGCGRGRLVEIPGVVPSLKEPIVGCAFAPRCAVVEPCCQERAPALECGAPDHAVACHRNKLPTAA